METNIKVRVHHDAEGGYLSRVQGVRGAVGYGESINEALESAVKAFFAIKAAKAVLDFRKTAKDDAIGDMFQLQIPA